MTNGSELIGMGTKVQIENYLPGHCSMRDLSRESNGASWPSCYGDNNYSNGQLYYGFLPRAMADSHPGYDKDVLKLTMLEHEAIFKNQVYELHRLYQVQRNLMDEVRKKQQSQGPIPYERSSSSSPVPSQMQSEDVRRWNGPSLLMANSFCGRHPIFGPDTNQSSPLSVKGKSIQAGPSPFQNCYSPKTSEVSESRPSKSRRRMLDLQLPAEDYIDTDEVEQFGGANFSDNPTPPDDKNGNFASGSGTLFNHTGRGECHGDASRSDSHACKSNALADLNEPLQFEEATTVSSVNFWGSVACQSDIQLKDLSSKYSSPSKFVPQIYRHGSLNENLNNLPSESRPNGQNWFCYTLESEQHKGSVRSINKETPPVPSQPAPCLLDQTGQPPPFLTCDRNKGDPWRAKSVCNLEKPDKSYILPSYNAFEPSLSSHVPSQRSLYLSSDLGKSGDAYASTCGKPNGCFNLRFAIQTNQSALSKSPQSSAQSNDLCGNRWNLNSSPGAHAAFGGEPSMRNGFYQGSSSSFKELPARFPQVGFDHVNCNYSDKSVHNSSNSYFKSATCPDMSSLKDMNLNVPLSNELSNNHFSLPDLKIMAENKKSEDPLAVLPWLRGKGTCSREADNPRKDMNSSEAVFCQDPFAPNDGDAKAQKHESNNCLSSRKILGVSIFDKPCSPKKENSPVFNSSAINHGARKEGVEFSQRKGGFDMNVPCEPSDSELDNMVAEAVVAEKKVQNESATLQVHFDLNSCVTEEESPCGTTLPDNNASIRGGTGIDLEVPVLLEGEEDVLDKEDPAVKEPEEHPVLPPDVPDDGEAELAKLAAEVIVGISSSVNQNQLEAEATCLPEEACQEEVLHWFVDVACSCGIDPESYQALDEKGENGGEDKDSLPEGLDDFESMTLRLKECNVEEYFPKPSIPEFPNIEGNGTCLLTTRTRKGQARRGRQRRDFQRDILPGLASLSRHEVTEDLQTFGGLMRATGHPWHSGPNRRNATRNGCGRGRKRSMAVAPVPVAIVRAPLKQQQLPSITAEIILEDRSLTGWGKTTRRPRRQRCPAGNLPPPVPLS